MSDWAEKIASTAMRDFLLRVAAVDPHEPLGPVPQFIDFIADQLRQAKAEARREGQRWRSMETAPKDGTRILAVCGKYGVQTIYWFAWGDAPEYFVKAGACWKPESRYCPINIEPTLWQPMPAAAL